MVCYITSPLSGGAQTPQPTSPMCGIKREKKNKNFLYHFGSLMIHGFLLFPEKEAKALF
jgi:hypothetical protein